MKGAATGIPVAAPGRGDRCNAASLIRGVTRRTCGVPPGGPAGLSAAGRENGAGGVVLDTEVVEVRVEQGSYWMVITVLVGSGGAGLWMGHCVDGRRSLSPPSFPCGTPGVPESADSAPRPYRRSFPAERCLIRGDDQQPWRRDPRFRGLGDLVELDLQPFLVPQDDRPELGIHCVGTDWGSRPLPLWHLVSPPRTAICEAGMYV